MYITSHSIRIVLLSRYVNIYNTMAPMSVPGFLWILVFSGGFFSREPPFGWTSESRITPESPEYSGIPVPAKQKYRDLTRDHGVGEALEMRRPISWAVVNVRPRPSTSP